MVCAGKKSLVLTICLRRTDYKRSIIHVYPHAAEFFCSRTAASTRASRASRFSTGRCASSFCIKRSHVPRSDFPKPIVPAGPLAWPLCSPDLNPMDFYLWGHVKKAVYRTKSRSIDELKQRITDILAAIPRGHLHNAFREFERRIRLIIANNGAHVENY